MQKLNKKTKLNSIQTIEAFAGFCACAGNCSCWNGFLWIGDTHSAVQSHLYAMSADDRIG